MTKIENINEKKTIWVRKTLLAILPSKLPNFRSSRPLFEKQKSQQVKIV